MGKQSTAEVLRLRAIKPSVYERSAKRFAQDDGFVGGLKGLEILPVGYAENAKKIGKVTGSQDDVFVVSWRCKKPASSRISIVCQTS